MQKRHLQFPEDADIVIKSRDLIHFNLSVKKQNLTEDLAGISLKIKKHDEMPMAWINFDRKHKHLLRGLNEKGMLSMQFIPGRYFVEAVYWPEGTVSEHRELECLGTVTIRETDSKKTLSIRSL